MSESLRNDGRIWVPKNKDDNRSPVDIPEGERDYYLERRYPAFGNLVPRDVASRAAKERCDGGYGVGETGLAVYLDFKDAIDRLGKDVVSARYGNLFEMYEKITGDNPYLMPMKIFPAVHYTMGGLWVDYDLMTTVPGLYAIGECNFSDHGANRLGASALMQGLADGYFVLPYTIGKYLSEDIRTPSIKTDHDDFLKAEKNARERNQKLLKNNGSRSVESFHRELGKIVWDHCGMSRNTKNLTQAIEDIKSLRNDFWDNVKVPGRDDVLNPELAKAGRVADFFELGELMMRDALGRDESCGGHFREEHQTQQGEALRDDENFTFSSAWEYKGDNTPPFLNKEELTFDTVRLTQRSYK
tara:strand:+ start:51 stop:1121 length:1071 start_codon:yes stop_codon:yes gene_type:complete